MLTQERLKQVLSYNPESGEWRWLISTNRAIKIGQIAGTVRRDGYRQIMVDGLLHFSGRLAWLYVTGEWPEEQVDHVNRERADDRWVNLREATWSENMANRKMPSHNTSGYIGVSWDGPSGKWDARVNKIRIGLFDDILKAVAARDAAALDMQGAFANLNLIHGEIS